MTTSQALDWYDKEHVEPNVVDKPRQRDAIANLKSYFKDTPLRDIDIAASRAYAEARRNGVVGGGSRRRTVELRRGSDSTIRRELNVLIAASNHAMRWKRLKPTLMPNGSVNPGLPVVELPAEHREKAPWLTKAALRMVLEKADGQLHDFCLLAYYWGARRRSVERLLKASVDLQHGRVDLNEPGRPRTKKRRPIVPVYHEVLPTLHRLMAESNTEFVFGTPRDFYREFVALCCEHGIEAQDMPAGKDPWPHLLRHSRATHMLMDGEDPYKVAKLLGDTLATVERVYGHHSVDYLKTHSTVEEVA